MEIVDNSSYNEYLKNLISNNELKKEYQTNLKIDLYMTLLSLNNSNYNELIYTKEISIIEDFLRKINNLKVKIQLKRKDNEIDELLNKIIDIYNNNIKIISKYNKDNLDIINIIKTKDTKEITSILDKLTKHKIQIISNKDYYDKIRKDINNNIFNNKYIINNNIITIDNTIITLDEFYEIFSYLLDINNYKNIYTKEEENILHNELITNIIDIINNEKEITKEIIPIILSNILYKNISNYEYINTKDFNIDNIKISDLYSFANNKIINNNTAKWRKILIPNEYLYNKIKEIVPKGMYYFKDDNFIIDNKDNDFKVSISINNIKTFLIDNIEKITN